MTMNKTIIQVDQDIQDLIPQFMENRRLDLMELDNLLNQKNFDQIARLAHKIKGTAGGYGFAELSSFASELEASAKQKDESALKNIAKKMKDHFSSVEVQFVQM